jgi:hypothetical protein
MNAKVFPGPQWSHPSAQQHPNPVPPPPQGYPTYPGQPPYPPPPQGYPSYPGQPYPYPVAGRGVDPEAPYGRDPVTEKPLSDKKAATAGVLQLFFGIFGAGRFYIGSKAIGGCQLGLTIVGVVLAQVTASSDTASGLVGLPVGRRDHLGNRRRDPDVHQICHRRSGPQTALNAFGDMRDRETIGLLRADSILHQFRGDHASGRIRCGPIGQCQ